MTYYDFIGYLAMVLLLISFLSDDAQKARLIGIFSAIFYGINIYYYGGFNGVFVIIVSILSKTLSFYIEKDELKYFNYISPFLALLYFYLFNEEGLIGVIPALSLVFIILADMQKQIIRMKQYYYIVVSLWLVYGIFLGSIPIILSEFLGLLTLFYSVYKIKNKNNIK